MKRKPLGCISFIGIQAVCLAYLLIIGVWFWRGSGLFSPGELNDLPGVRVLGGVRTHAETSGQCSTCHPAPWSGDRMSDRCLDCHTDLYANTLDFHSVMITQGHAGECNDCHPDHRGAQAALTSTDLVNFPHNAIGYSLRAHQQLADGSSFACSDCHVEDLTDLDLATCISCHTRMDANYMQAHLQVFGEKCLACHDGIDRFGHDFDHNLTPFTLEGNHAVLMCSDCHTQARTAEDLINTPQVCVACHAEVDPHQGGLGEGCADCHNADDWKQASFDHSLAVFQLTGGHTTVACQDCHTNGVFKGTSTDCITCHAEDDAHQGRFGTDCAVCHNADSWDQASFNHSLAAFQLTGWHTTVACQNCHTDGVFKGTPMDCITCHPEDDEHQGRFGVDCAGCHNADGWDQVSFDHSLATFQLTGAHLSVSCEDCHTAGVFAGTPTTCSACHAEPSYHLGLFDPACVSCHSIQAWSPAKYDRLHTFPIDHGERGVSTCQTCHDQNLASYTCYGCHDHNQAEIAAEHRDEAIRDFGDCSRCHPTGLEDEAESDDD